MAEKKRGSNQLTFEYEVFDKRNIRLKGEISARSLTLAKANLKSQGFNIIKIKRKSVDILEIFKSTKIKPVEVTLFTRQLATLTTAGIPLVQALGLVADTLPDSPLFNLIQKIKVDIESGSSFSQVLKKHPQVFDELYCGLVEAGEQAGTLDIMLNRIAAYKEKVDSLKRKVKKALYYPIAVLIIAAIVTTILLIKVVPTFKTIFEGYGAELPAFTQFVLWISESLQNYGLYILGVIVLIFFTLRYLYQKNLPFNHAMQRMSLKIPVIGPILQKTAIARFTRTLATTSEAGVPLVDGLDTVSRAAGNIVFEQAILKIKDALSVGQQMKTAMKRSQIFPALVVQMIGIGEESGALDTMLGKVAALYEEEVDTQVDGLTTLLEPLIMAILGVIVGGLVVAMYLPIFKMGALF